MKIIVTHSSPDWDAVGSVWLLKKFLPGWQEAKVEFVPAGQRRVGSKQIIGDADPIEKIGEDEVIHVDTGLGPLDHHQTPDQTVSATSRSFDFIKEHITASGSKFTKEHSEAASRIVKIIVATDHFKEVFWQDPTADYHEFSLLGVLEGLKFQYPDQDTRYLDFGITCLDALLHTFENRIWAEREIKENGIKFQTKAGDGIGFATMNDTVLKLAQKMGFVLVVRKDPRKGYVRIKVRPSNPITSGSKPGKETPDLTLAYEKLRKVDPEATWFLHVSRKMLLNGTPKNPKMIATKLTLKQIIDVLKSIY